MSTKWKEYCKPQLVKVPQLNCNMKNWQVSFVCQLEFEISSLPNASESREQKKVNFTFSQHHRCWSCLEYSLPEEREDVATINGPSASNVKARFAGSKMFSWRGIVKLVQFIPTGIRKKFTKGSTRSRVALSLSITGLAISETHRGKIHTIT